MSTGTETSPSASSDASNIQTSPALSPTSRNTMKRKFEDAILSLDEAVGSTDIIEMPPSKKFKPGRSIYSTLAKYGILRQPKPKPSETDASRLEALSKTAPHLTAILSRTATRTRKAFPFKFGHQPSPSTVSSTSKTTAEYRPSSTTSFLSRLATFKLSTYANKPPAIDAVAAAKCGWVNDGKDRLLCGICNAPWVVAGTAGMSRDAANALVEKQRMYLVDMHKDACPWKSKQCDASIYRVPLQTPAAMAKEVKIRAQKLDSVMTDVQIKHPLTSAQAQSLISTMSAIKLLEFPRAPDSTSSSAEGSAADVFVQSEPSETAALTALFGWDILPPTPPTPRPRTPSASRAASVAPSSASAAPGRTVRDSVSLGPGTRSTSPAVPSKAVSLSQRPGSVLPAGQSSKPETTLLHCRLCQRRIGLWAFLTPAQPNGPASPSMGVLSQPRRQLDVLKEHRSYCPYVVRSTVVPSFPISPTVSQTPDRASPTSFTSPAISGQPGAVEGWRAVWTVITRYGALQRQRLGFASTQAQAQPAEGVMEDEVQAMVDDVKKRGGKHLLKYVKGLLG